MPDRSKQQILVIAELDPEGAPSDATLSVVTFVQQLSRQLDADWYLLTTADVRQVTDSSLRGLGANALFCCPAATDLGVTPEQLTPSLRQLVQAQRIDYVVAAANHFGKALMPHLAALLDAAHVGDCTGFRHAELGPMFQRPIFAGVVSACGRASSTTVTLTVRHSDFSPAIPSQSCCPVTALTWCESTVRRKDVIETRFKPLNRPALQDARTVICGGQALGSRYFELLEPLADAYGAALGATRALCDSGQVPSGFQVGQTGKVVAPDLYFAIGVSGSIQHLAGMRNSKTIVAVNIDPNAPIFDHAHFGIVGDMWQIVPELVAAVHRRRRNQSR